MSMLGFLSKGSDHGNGNGKVKHQVSSPDRRGVQRKASSKRGGWFRGGGGGDKRNTDEDDGDHEEELGNSSGRLRATAEKQKRKSQQQKLEQQYAALEEECTKLKFQQTQLVALQDQRKHEGSKVQKLISDLEGEQKQALNVNYELRAQIETIAQHRQDLSNNNNNNNITAVSDPPPLASDELRDAQEALERRKVELQGLQRQKEEAMAKGDHLMQWIQELRQSETIADETLAKKKRIEELQAKLNLLKEGQNPLESS
mmetsp:Transcript_25490/g.37272  ORF Transcript_25490/g.37272 Transcript_25490/m.37272 type:complete len:258 (-) Transcript_25490:244-1017(-)|eukprot:CAMPEP_0194069950 /NCGR_PEP_ID=MMETSP0009_2-20130614/87916_1 /TAXON_ID=210454 /ORGANISM="Grammatophora oceanica, Strain CCMP 410" /LENGTH=257 /DNA_ID=CAMNT_0038723177 /DNA_START=57 /DNA_END=833 /DNA_ORIENTATION=+